MPATVATITTPSLTLIELQPVERPHRAAPPARSRRRARCARGPSPSLRRSPRTCESTVRWPEPSRQPQTSASSCSREKTDAGPRGQQRQQVELGRGQVHDLAAEPHAAAPPGRSPARRRRTRVAGRRRPPLDPPQQRAHARDELARGERLGHVVVGADGEPDEQVGLLAARGQHQHRHRPVALHAAADLEPVEPGQHQVEHHEVGPHAVAQRDAGVAVVRHLDRRSPRPAAARRRRAAITSSSSITQISGPLTPPSVSAAVWERVRRILWRFCAESRAMQLTLIRSRDAAVELGGPRAAGRPAARPRRAPATPCRTRPTRAATRSCELPEPAEARRAPASTRSSSPTCTRDHFDDDRARAAAARRCRSSASRHDAERLHADGFTDVRPVYGDAEARRPADRAHRRPPRHGRDRRGDGAASRASCCTRPASRALYIAGDTILCDEVRAAVAEHEPARDRRQRERRPLQRRATRS